MYNLGMAVQRFEALTLQYPHDPLVALHLQRLRTGDRDDLMVMVDK